LEGKMESKDATISYLSRRVLTLKKENIDLKKALSKIESIMMSIGGPLNDNTLRYSVEQLRPFVIIKGEIKAVI